MHGHTNPARLTGYRDRFMIVGKPVGGLCMFDDVWRPATGLDGEREHDT